MIAQQSGTRKTAIRLSSVAIIALLQKVFIFPPFTLGRVECRQRRGGAAMLCEVRSLDDRGENTNLVQKMGFSNRSGPDFSIIHKKVAYDVTRSTYLEV